MRIKINWSILIRHRGLKKLKNMTFRTYVWGIRAITWLSLATLGFVINYIDPEKSAPAGIIIFYFILFFFAVGFFNLMFLFLRRKFLNAESAAASVDLSFRQGVLLAVALLGIILLQNFRVLVWWDALLVVAGVFLIELYFLSKS